MRLRVPSAFVDAALASANRVKTVSFEVPDPSIEATVRKWIAGTTTRETLYFRPGDPWLSGHAQVAQGADNYVMGLFEVIRWTKGAPGMPDLLAKDIFTTGLVPDETSPPLKYADNPATWPPIPDNWN